MRNASRCQSTAQDSGRHALPRAVPLSAIFLCASCLAHAATLPEGPGKAETTRVCGKCHSLDQAVSLRQGQAGWTTTISKMVDLGAEGSDAEFAAILNYLVKNYSGGTSNPSSPGTTPANVLPGTQPPDNAGAPDAARNPELPSPGNRRVNPESFRPGPPLPAAREWPTYGHDRGRPALLSAHRTDARERRPVEVAWIYHMRPPGFTGSAAAFPTMEGRGPGGAVGDTPEAPRRGGRGRFEFWGSVPAGTRPLVRNGIMYIATPYSRALPRSNPVTGQELWSFPLPSGNPSTRGVESLGRGWRHAGSDRLRVQRRQALFPECENRTAQS